jgi:sulfate adenylyltransferase (ADP) / ATP adenylyltransferase
MTGESRLTLLQNPGILWQRVIAQTDAAIASGALLSIPTAHEWVEDQGTQFLVRIVTNLVRKEQDKQQQEKKTKVDPDFNPFLPYEEALFVVDVSETHVCLLNKFNVVNYHLLIITREFEEQESLLNLKDFEALWTCLAEFDGLGFYNAGTQAGASQRHKHLQLMPLPLSSEDEVPIPIEPSLIANLTGDSVVQSSTLPFKHGLVKLDPKRSKSVAEGAQMLLEAYQNLLRSLSCYLNSEQPAPYNLLVTREWMFLVPRSQDSYKEIPVNSLGFAGALLVRNTEQLEFLKTIHPMTLLQKVGIAKG